MDEPVRWVTKAEAAEELEVSLSTLDRMIGRRDVEVRWEGRRVFVRMHGLEYLSDEELLRRAIIREEELEADRAGVGTKRLGVAAWSIRVGEGAGRGQGVRNPPADRPYAELEEAYRKETAAHKETKEVVYRMLRVTAVVLLVICGLLTWRLFI